ncbi:MAG: DNA alkylation repair protein, partial [Candidatus Levybacteria bacterium]|nr:DNA alkylation repair protein [Candidatus Levybacteria bacterium]
MDILRQLQQELKVATNPEKAKISQRYFKTGKGEYGEGTKFIGVDTGIKRKLAKKYVDLELSDIEKLLNNKIHDYRFVALIILNNKFRKAGGKIQKKIFNLYLRNTKNINNWDLVDLSAHKIVGLHLLNKNTDILMKLAKSKSLWERRIAVLATFQFIKNKQYSDSLEIAEILLNDEHDLIH